MTSSRDTQRSDDSSLDPSVEEQAHATQNDPTVGDHTLVEPTPPGAVDPQATTKHGERAFDPLQSGPARPVTTVSDFVESISLSGLMSRAELEKFQERFDSNSDPKTLVESLVREQKLTGYQASALQRGHVRGLLLGNYEVLDRIGHGGMGVVYRARHRRMKREVALKILPATVSGRTEGIERFTREVQAAARLQHPNIAAAFDADVQGNTHYLAMELIEGPNLSGYVKEAGPLPLAVAVQLVIQAAHGLAYAHSQGVVHRDVKPGNLLVNRDGVVKILDMGLAQFSRSADDPDQAELTQSGRIMGTVDYMAPEQAVDAKSVDHRADIYSIGCTLYYLLAGEPMSPPGPLTKKLLWHQNSPPPSLRSIRPEVPVELDQIYLQMVAKSPEERQRSMAVVASELEAVLATLSYSDLQLPMVGITLNANPGSVSGSSSRPVELPPSIRKVISDHDSSPSNPTVILSRDNSIPRSKLPWLLAGCAAALLVAVVLLGNIWSPFGSAEVAVNNDEIPPTHFANDPPTLGNAEVPPSVGDTEVPPVEPPAVEQLPGERSPAVGPAAVASAAGTDLARHQPLLKWVFDHQGSVSVKFDGESKPLKISNTAAELVKPFQLVGIDLAGSQVADAELPQLNSVADSLTQLSLARTPVTDAGLEHVWALKHLRSLDLSDTKITGASVSQMSRLSKLENLSLKATPLGNAAATRLTAVKSLRHLDLSGTEVSDLGVEQLAALKSLETLALFDTAITKASEEALEAVLPNLQLQWEGVDLDRQIAKTVQEAGGSLVYRMEQGNVSDQQLSPNGSLPPKRISIVAIDLSRAEPLDDSFLAQLAVLEHLTSIELGTGKYTLRGLQTLMQEAKSLKTLDIGELQLPEGKFALQTAVTGIEVKSKEPTDVAVAHSVLDHGGSVVVAKGNSSQTVTTRDALPAFPFQVKEVLWGAGQPLTEAHAAELPRLRSLEVLSLAESAADSAALKHISSSATLRELDLGATAINAEAIRQLANLPRLSILRIENAPLTGAELAEFSLFNSLEELSLRASQFDLQALSSLKLPANLRKLDLSATPLDDTAVPELVKHKQLTQLTVLETDLSDAAQEQLVKALPKAKVSHDPLDPQRQVVRWAIEKGGSVSVDQKVLTNLSQLPRNSATVTAIDLSAVPPGQFKPNEIAQQLAYCSSLERAVLKGQVFGDSVPQALLLSPGVRTLDLSNTSLRDEGLRALAPLKKLQSLDVSGTRLTSASAATLQHWPELQSLKLYGVPFTSTDLAALAQLKLLSELSLGNRTIDDAAMKHLVSLPLTKLTLRGSIVSDDGLRTLSQIKTLRVLDLGQTRVTDAGIASLTGLPLVDLRLDGTDITNSGLSTLGQLKSLTRLDVSQTMATKEGVEALRTALPGCNIPATSLRSEEIKDQVPVTGGGIFSGG